jgi:hypothetical protein
MTKHHFEAFAKEIRNTPQSLEARWYAARVIAGIAQQDNPQFDVSRFLKACGLE